MINIFIVINSTILKLRYKTKQYKGVTVTKKEREELIAFMLDSEEVKQRTYALTDEQKLEYVNNLIDIYELQAQDAQRYGTN